MIGEHIGNFRLVSQLGRGGMGEVFLATHTELDTPAAVKLLNLDISENREHVQRFFNEARIVSKIKHAGRVQIFDSGYHKGQAYLVMELLEGESLAKRLERVGRLPISEALDICGQIASVLDATQRAGITHRDLKPDNIFIVKDHERPTGERVKILDFGIAKLSSGTMANLPKTSGTMGTPTYMAPEQWGDASNVDWRADAYSLGCVAFELVVGRPPFVCASIPEAYTKHLNETPPLVRTRRPDVPAELEALIAQLLAKQPTQRASSFAAIAAQLSVIAGGRSTASQLAVTVAPDAPSPPPPTVTTIGGSAAQIVARAPRRRSLWIGVASLAVVAVVATIAVNRSRHDDAPSHPAIPAVAPAVAQPSAPPPAEPPASPADPPATSAVTPAPPDVAPPPTPPIHRPERASHRHVAEHITPTSSPHAPPAAVIPRVQANPAAVVVAPVAATNAHSTAQPPPDAGKPIYKGTKGSIITSYPGN